MAELRHALFADFVSPGHRGKPAIVGLFENLYIPAGHFDTMTGPFYLFLQIDCSVAEGSHHRIELTFVDGNSHPIGTPKVFENVGLVQSGPGLPLTGKLITQLHVQFPEHGEFTMQVRVDGNLLEGCPMMTVSEPPPARVG